MSIGMERFGSNGLFPTYDPGLPIRKTVALFHLQCSGCGYEPAPEVVVAPRICPKCHGSTFERYARPGSILENAERYDD